MSTIEKEFSSYQALQTKSQKIHNEGLDVLKNIVVSTSDSPNTLNDVVQLTKEHCDLGDLFLDYAKINQAYSSYQDLLVMEKGGFSHSDIGDVYGAEQLNSKYMLSRQLGYDELCCLLQRNKAWKKNSVLLDTLAGNGTFERVIKSLYKNTPICIGNDVSLNMVVQGIKNNQMIFYTDIRNSIIRDNIADYGVCAYGSHHIPVASRPDFFKGCFAKIKLGGNFILQDFETGTPTERFYSECLDDYRSYGHNYAHFTREGMASLISNAGFQDVEPGVIYDPFIIAAEPNESDEELTFRFYQYIVTLFVLDKLYPSMSYNDENFKILDDALAKYFAINDNCISAINIQGDASKKSFIEESLTIKHVNNVKYLVAPRVAIYAIGTKKCY